MIVGFFHQGSGLGNQLHRLVATRVRAADLGVDWSMVYNPDSSGKPADFKGSSFMDIGRWNKGSWDGRNEWVEKCVRDALGVDIRGYDPEFNFVADGTLIEGEFQDERYWQHREKDVDSWLKVEPLEMPDDLCVVGFRGGEFSLYPDLFLTKDYYDQAIGMMLRVNPQMRFEVHTDDAAMAERLFPGLKVVHNIGINWRSMRYAKYAIIANSSFFILPRWLNHGTTIAPRYWGRRNTKTWCLPQNYYKRFTYI